MDYTTVLQSLRNIVENELIEKEGLTVVYALDEKAHRQLDEEIFIQVMGTINGFEHQDVFEIEVGGIIAKFVRKDLED